MLEDRVAVLEKALYEAICTMDNALRVIDDLGDLEPDEFGDEMIRIHCLKDVLHQGCDEKPKEHCFCTKQNWSPSTKVEDEA